jgi:hypothetical protein
MKIDLFVSSFLLSSVALSGPAVADSVLFSTGNPDGRMAAASRSSLSAFEIETADDFVLTNQSIVNSATFTGLLSNTSVANISNVTIEIYRIFPLDSDIGRTTGSPTFSTSQVPTRVNSPSDVALDSRMAGTNLTFSVSSLSASFTAANSVQPGGIHPTPLQTTGGNGSVTGEEVQFSVTFTTPFNLAAGHYFFVPQVDVNNGGVFDWLSAPKPIASPGTPFPPGFTDLQAWTRDQALDPDWLRIGTDIVGGQPVVAPTFNMAFSLSGVEAVPELSTWAMMLVGFASLGYIGFRQRKRMIAA